MADKKKNKPAVKKPSVRKAKPAKPNKEKAPSVEHNVGSEFTDGFTRSLAGDKSLQAYKDLINGMTSSLNPDAKETMTEEQWVESWKKFWSKADSTSKTKKTNELSVDGASETKKTDGINIEDTYPGVTEQIRQYKEAEWPSCPHCSSSNTAKVSYAIIGRTITLAASIEEIVSHPGMRVNCDVCGEEIMNERELKQNGIILCRACAGNSYYRVPVCIPGIQSRVG